MCQESDRLLARACTVMYECHFLSNSHACLKFKMKFLWYFFSISSHRNQASVTQYFSFIVVCTPIDKTLHHCGQIVVPMIYKAQRSESGVSPMQAISSCFVLCF